MRRSLLTTLLAATWCILAQPAVGGANAAPHVRVPRTALAAPGARADHAFPAGATHFTAGFQIDTPARVSNAAADGITTDIEYNGPPSPRSKLGKALAAAGMTVVDARISDELFYWECHRTHTVAPPPPGEANWYCHTDEDPRVDSPEVVLAAVRKYLREDAANPLVSGYWVLDDWPQWDGGSARSLLVEVHAAIDELTPASPAICGFGGSIEPIGQTGGFDSATAANYSNAGCDMIGLYNYANTGVHRSGGRRLEWTIKILLGEEREDLEKLGWVQASTPMLGIGQAWGGPYGKHEYQPGLSAEQIVTEARAFCADGAASIGWYAWDDSGFRKRTRTPNDSHAITDGIMQGVAACAELGAG